MTASELNRKLLFYGYDDLAGYLKNSPLNRYLYKVLLAYIPQRHLDVPIERMFSEIYYQIIRVRFDSKPGYDIEKRYLDEEVQWLKSSQYLYSEEATEVIFSIVWVLFQLRRTLSFHEECFIERLKPIVKSFDYQNHQEGLLEDMRSKDIKVPDEIPPQPCPVSDIPYAFAPSYDGETGFRYLYLRFFYIYGPNKIKGENMWRVLTDNFSHSIIEKYVSIYKNPEDQESLLERIRFACSDKERRKHEDFFYMLGASISNEKNNGQKSICCQITHEDENGNEVSTFDFVGAAAKEYLDNYSRELKSVADQYKEERDAALKQCEELKASHELELARIEAQHFTELRRQAFEQGYTSGKIEKLEKALKKAREAQSEPSLSIKEMVAHVKSRFSKSAAEEFCTMYYHLALEQGGIDEVIAKLVDSIVPYIIERDKPQQTIHIPPSR